MRPSKPVTLAYVEETLAVVDGVAPGSRVVVEGAQNLRPGSSVSEAQREGQEKGEPRKGGEGPGPKSKGKA